MNKRPGHVTVTTEVSYCSFCGRARNLRREEHQLGNFIRTVVTCETCHRTLASTMGVASTDAPASAETPAASENAASTATRPASASKPQPAKRAAAAKGKAPSTKPKAPRARSKPK
jgi:hypothetical protein